MHDLSIMPSQLQEDNAEHNEIPQVNPHARVRRSSLQYQDRRLSKEKVLSLGERKHLKLGKAIERNDSDQHAATTDEIGIENSVPGIPLGTPHKPCSSREVTGGDDVVKYMSSVPSYLQRIEMGDSVQGKALNFGVLDWGCLEKWTYQVANRRGKDSPSSTNSSSEVSCSTFGSSSMSTKSTDSPFVQRNRSPASNAPQSSSIDLRQTELVDEQNSVQTMSKPDSKTSRGRPSGKGEIRYSNMKSISVDKPPYPDIGSSSSISKANDIPNFGHNKVKSSSSSTSKANDIPDFGHNKVRSQIYRSRGEDKFHNCEQPSFPGNLHFAEDWLQDQCSVVEGVWDHLQESEHARRISYDSAAVSNRSAEVHRKSFSGNFPPSDYQFDNQSPHIPYLCPLPSISQIDESSVSRTLLSENEVLIPASVQDKHIKLGQSTESLSEKSVSYMADKSGRGELKAAATPRREFSPHRLINAGMNMLRSSTLREGSSGQQLKQGNSHEDNATSNSRSRSSVTPHCLLSSGLNRIRKSSLREGSPGKEMKQAVCSDSSREENAGSNARSRRSPLQRILDPLLKSKDQIHFCGPDTGLTRHRAREVSNGDNLPIRVELKSADVSCKLPSQITEADCSGQAEKQGISTRQALLKLAWKNGLPFFVFSANDNDIFAATMGKGSVSQKKDFSCIYTIFTAQDIKKKGGVLLGQGNKSKKHDLVYNVVGKMRVTSFKSTGIGFKDSIVMREFVLFGRELAITTNGCVNSPLSSELAAIVIQVPNEMPEDSDVQSKKKPGLSSVFAIIPCGIHGVSSTGEPTPLIEKWKSGGSCDCGGWDEGCMLTILTDKIQESSSSSSSQACSADGTYGIELFPQVRHLDW